MDNTEQLCTSYLNCQSNVCPLDEGIKNRTYIKGEKICRKILDYMEGRPTGLDDKIKETEFIWRSKYGNATLEKRLKGRKHIRDVFRKVSFKAEA
jgi:hypothetical protein